MFRAKPIRTLALGVSLLISGVLLTLMVRLDRPLRTEAAPHGMISFELSGSRQGAQSILESWDTAARAAARASLRLDYAFLVAYAAALSLLCLILTDALPPSQPGLKRLGQGLAWGQWLAAALDAAENIMLGRLLRDSGDHWLAPAASACATIKFTLVGLALLFFMGAGFIVSLRHAKGGGDASANQ